MDIRDKLPAKYPYELNPDAEQGFVDAVHNNQINLAMYYMVNIVGDMQDTVAKLRTEVAELKQKASAKTTTKKKTTKTSEE